MPTASSLSLTAGSFVQGFQRQQAQRNADQAYQNAQSLQSRAREARQDAARAQQTARELEIRAGQAQSEASRVSINVKASSAIETTQTDLNASYSKLPEQITTARADTYGATAAVNTSASSVGTVVDTTA